MKRPQRYLFIIMTVLVAVYLLLTRLPPAAALALLGVLVLYASIAVVWGRDLLLARRNAKRREWAKALERFERFEKKLLRSRFHRLAIVLYPNIYSLDGVAVTRNGIGQVLLNAGDLDRAVQWLRSALQRDPYYPLPYVNLALVAARRRDDAGARRDMTRAVQLGFDPRAAQRILHRALAAAEAGIDDRDRR